MSLVRADIDNPSGEAGTFPSPWEGSNTVADIMQIGRDN